VTVDDLPHQRAIAATRRVAQACTAWT